MYICVFDPTSLHDLGVVSESREAAGLWRLRVCVCVVVKTCDDVAVSVCGGGGNGAVVVMRVYSYKGVVVITAVMRLWLWSEVVKI